jgi:hypothetical protein
MTPKRFFAFGCSYTNYFWPTWADILGAELQNRADCEVYNFGELGCSNQFIAQQVAIADLTYNFTKDDFVAICWTHIFREDRYIENHPTYSDGWLLLGSLLDMAKVPHTGYNDLTKITGPTQVALRDYSLMYYTIQLLQKTHTCYMSVRNHKEYTQFVNELFPVQAENFNYINTIFGDAVTSTEHDFFKLQLRDKNKIVNKKFNDLHPFPIDYLTFLTDICQIDISNKIKQMVVTSEDTLCDLINIYTKNSSKSLSEIKSEYAKDPLASLAQKYRCKNPLTIRSELI